MSELLKGLNKQQEQAIVETVENSALVLAGAGSGKTRVLTNRIAYLIQEEDVKPTEIMAVTFTNKASKEMQERIAKTVGEDVAKKITVGTFHKICILMLKQFGHRNDISKSFTIADKHDQEQVMKKILEGRGIEPKQANIRYFLSKISGLKNELYTPKRLYDSLMADPNPKQDEQVLYKIYKGYQKRLREINKLDFDDLLTEAVFLLSKSEKTRDYYQHRFRYLMSDEFQDTNPAQYQLIRYLSGKDKPTITAPNNVFVVGDVDQSIYGFRSADIEIILSFEEDFPNAKLIKLEQNYRSTKNIVEAGNAIVENNKKRKEKTAFTSNIDGEPVRIGSFMKSEHEADWIVKRIKQLKKKGYHYKDCAILYRANFISRELESKFIENRIPYNIIGGVQFFDRMEIKDTMAYMKVVANPADDIAMERVLSTYPGVGKTTIKDLQTMATNHHIPLSKTLQKYEPKRKATQNALDTLRELLQQLHMIYKVSNQDKSPNAVYEFMNVVWKRSGYVDKLKQKKDKVNFSRLENLAELERVVKIYQDETTEPTIDDFLESILLKSQADDAEDGDEVSLMTVHASKGLEFPIVFVAAMEENIFPHKNAMNTEDDIEEERRLAYVAVTRAEKEVYLTYSTMRQSYQGGSISKASRFLQEIPEELVETI